jgi:hypothetical protein
LKGEGEYDDNDLVPDLVQANNIHIKFREDLRTYLAHEIPAIGVMSFNVTEVDDNRDETQMMIQIVNKGGDLSDMDQTVKIIIWKIWNMLKAQRPNKGNICLQDNADDIENMSADIIHGGIEEQESDDFSDLFVIGEIRFTIISKGDN